MYFSVFISSRKEFILKAKKRNNYQEKSKEVNLELKTELIIPSSDKVLQSRVIKNWNKSIH